MTALTNNELTDERLAQLANRSFYQVDGELYVPLGDEIVLMAAELQERRKADSARPVAYTTDFYVRELDKSGLYQCWLSRDARNAEYNVPLFAAPQSVLPPPEMPAHTGPRQEGRPQAYVDGWNACRDATLQSFGNSEQLNSPVTGIYDDVLNIIGLLENNEWAEHCTSTVLGSLLKSEITRLVSKEQPVPVVSFYRDGIEAAASWVDKQRQAFDNEHGRYDSDTGAFEFGNDAQRDYSDTLAELADGIRGLHPNAGDNSPVTPDGWISCSERMPPTNVAVLVCVNGVVQKSVFCWDGESWGDWYDEYDELAQTTFTHWMPLPEPPQEVNRG
ncbi:DUF551 domain-containing protein [Salmonella enterica]|nr:DUF551 domain-containing protein [Salmonella enterica]EDX4410956.1 DUF551 domain-containing protein [Salmonella enterica subsp. houtenae serovar 44:z36,[z38]:-]EEB1684296.1 DUF551 domain-containing protein [Salmonella enterica]EEC2543043.1 DUF551 domain-containing protein [Salmonella enterica]EFB0109531.1 DUF551 domain-containing protein [Salmonella enterica]